MTKHGFLFLLLGMSLVLAGCMHEGDSGDNGPVSTVDIISTSAGFEPTVLNVTVGTTVRWTNLDSVRHNVVADDDSWGMDTDLLGQGQTFEHTFTEPGEYPYHCWPHQQMQGTVVVTAADEDADA